VGGAGRGGARPGRGSENVEEENVACCDDVEGFSWWLDSFRSASSLCSWNVSEATFSFFGFVLVCLYTSVFLEELDVEISR